nr:NADH dehydrogenase subunit 2 [Microperla geei]
MLNNPTKLLFFMTLLSGTLISISANSWYGAWMGLEINLLSFIPLMSSTKNLMSTEASLKYFLTQALASATLLFTVILASLMLNSPNSLIMNNNYLIILINSSLLLKMGAAPFHFWFPGVMEGLSWSNILLLMTWQKIAPMMLLSYNLSMDMFMTTIIISSIIIGSLGGLNQTSLRKILAYSSINHLGWLISAMFLSETVWNIYFSTYVFLSSTLVFMFQSLKLSHVNQIFSMNFIPPVIKFSLFLTLLSLGGLPPFLGFLPKWIVIQSLASNGMTLLVITMTVMTLITLFYYLRTAFSVFLLSYSESLWNISMTSQSFFMKFTLTLTMISTLGLTCSILLYQIF